jgi:hypothetical protein
MQLCTTLSSLCHFGVSEVSVWIEFLRRLRLLSSSLSSLARSRYTAEYPYREVTGTFNFGVFPASTSFIRNLRMYVYFFLVKICREFNKSLLSLEVVGSSTG